ncbi:hypothetical protein [Trichormus azollae]|jgi:hypothetical protein|uniref:hypothetical protein n=1 Tax=Trichormus azollae TaxID=1164 RepID=UPI000195761E|nr:hypothetical protein [Trichormus azollae]
MELTKLKEYRGRVCISLRVFHSCIGCPDIQPEVSNRRITGQRFSFQGFPQTQAVLLA